MYSGNEIRTKQIRLIFHCSGAEIGLPKRQCERCIVDEFKSIILTTDMEIYLYSSHIYINQYQKSFYFNSDECIDWLSRINTMEWYYSHSEYKSNIWTLFIHLYACSSIYSNVWTICCCIVQENLKKREQPSSLSRTENTFSKSSSIRLLDGAMLNT